jgi:hypothetical protein
LLRHPDPTFFKMSLQPARHFRLGSGMGLVPVLSQLVAIALRRNLMPELDSASASPADDQDYS